MKFQNPGQELAFSTVLSVAVGLIILALAIPLKHYSLVHALAVAIVVPGIAIWFQSRGAAYLFAAFSVVLAGGLIYEMISDGNMTWSNICRAAARGYFATIAAQWAKRRKRSNTA